MGELVRQYWIPFLPARDLPRADGDPIKVRLLGEDLVAFPDCVRHSTWHGLVDAVLEQGHQ